MIYWISERGGDDPPGVLLLFSCYSRLSRCAPVLICYRGRLSRSYCLVYGTAPTFLVGQRIVERVRFRHAAFDRFRRVALDVGN